MVRGQGGLALYWWLTKGSYASSSLAVSALLYNIATLNRKDSKMTIISLEASKWGISLETYFGDIYLYHRTWMLALGLVAVLLVAKLIRKRAR